MEEKARLKRIREKELALKATKMNKRRQDRERAKEKAERKKVNEMRSSKLQLIQNMHKTRKWNRAARKTLAKLPAEVFYEKFK